MVTVNHALQALTFPLRLRLFLPPPCFRRKLDALSLPLGFPSPPPPPPTPSEGRGHSGETEGACALWGLLSPFLPFGGGWGTTGAVAPGGAGDSTASSPTGIAVAGFSRSQESLVLAAPSSVASSVSREHDRRSRSRWIEESAEARSSSRSSCSSPSRDRESREGHCCACSRSGGSRGGSRGSRSRSTDRFVRGLIDGGAPTVTRLTPLLPVCGLGGPGRSLRPATGIIGCAHALGVTVRSLDESARVCLAVTRPSVTGPGHTGPATGHVTALPSLRTIRGLVSGVVGLGRVA